MLGRHQEYDFPARQGYSHGKVGVLPKRLPKTFKVEIGGMAFEFASLKNLKEIFRYLRTFRALSTVWTVWSFIAIYVSVPVVYV